MFEEAFKKEPNNEELAAQTFFANVRAGRWNFAQQVNSDLIVYTYPLC
jgi:N-terminal acetyltransferase B complex non-catalytic subunit